MLKKFSLFFRSAEIDLGFSPFALRLDNQTYQIMRASSENITDLLSLEQEVYFGRTSWNRFSFKSELKRHTNSLHLVVYQGSTLVGFVGIRMQAQEGHVTNVAVKPAFQKRGAGGFLLKTMIGITQRNHAVQVTLEVRSDDYNTQSLYRKIGFRGSFIRKNYYSAEYANAISMIRKITNREQEEIN